MENFYARTVFFVKDAEQALAHYTERLGFKLDWTHQEQGRVYVFQVSLFGFELILNQIEDWTKDRASHGRVFIGLEPDQAQALLAHVKAKNIQTTTFSWGKPTLVIHDMDGNELFFWPPGDTWDTIRTELGVPPI